MSPNRDRISEVTLDLYLSDGIEGVSMRRVARRVGVSAPAIYRHFPSKDALLNEIVVAGLRHLEGHLAPALEADTPLARLRALVDGYLEFALEQPRYFDFVFLHPNLGVDRFEDEISRPMWDTFRVASDQVAACMEEETIARSDPLTVAIMIWAEAHGLITLYRTGRFREDPESFRGTFRRAIDRMFEGLRES